MQTPQGVYATGAKAPYDRRLVALVCANFFDQNFSSIVNGIALGMLIFVLAI